MLDHGVTGPHLEGLLGGTAGRQLKLATIELFDERLAVAVALLDQRLLR